MGRRALRWQGNNRSLILRARRVLRVAASGRSYRLDFGVTFFGTSEASRIDFSLMSHDNRVMRYRFGLILSAILGILPVSRGSRVTADPIDDCVQRAMQEQHLPGVAVAIIQGGKVVKLAGYGFANLEWQIPVTPQTEFQIQSVTKSFTATAIMMLVQEGKLSVDGDLASYLDGTPEAWAAIRIRHLLSHTSGIPDFINKPQANLRLERTEKEVLEELIGRPVEFKPGEKYSYSNSNYHLLAMIIRKVTDRSYGAFLKERIFDPLGMSATRVVSWSDVIPRRAAGYRWNNGAYRNGQFIGESILAYGGGGLLSTAEDLAKWDLGLREGRVLPKPVLEQMWTPTRLNDGSMSYYGFGWGVGGTTPHRFVHHSGAHSTGFTSYLVRYLDDDLSIVVLVNANHGKPAELGRAIAEICSPALKS